MADRTRKLIRNWDRVAPHYDSASGFIERRWFAACRPWVCERAHGKVLEVCTGTGLNFPHYSRNVILTATDWSDSMLEQARARADQLALPVTLQRADAMQLPFADAMFDSVTCTFGLCCVPDDRTALTEMLRVLKPGGDLLLADHISSTVLPLLWLQKLLNLVLVRSQGEYLTRRPLLHLQTLDVDIIQSKRTSMGFMEQVHARKK